MDYALIDRLEPAAQKARSALEMYKRAAVEACEAEAEKPVREKAELQCQMVDLLVVVEAELGRMRRAQWGQSHAS